jgi:uncharacterized protein YdhG (YjbR/CyaY superfamily)
VKSLPPLQGLHEQGGQPLTDSEQKPRTIDEYIASCPGDVQPILRKIRALIRQTAPEAAEKISYQLPTFTLHGRNLVHFGAFKKHIGFYPTPFGIEQFGAELAPYQGAKGSVQFPLDQPIPYDLIRKIVEFRVGQEDAKAAAQAKSRPARSQDD